MRRADRKDRGDERESIGRDIENSDPLQIQQSALLATILEQTPATLEGHQLRARAVLEWQGGMGANGKRASAFNSDVIWLVIRDLVGQSAIDTMTAALCAGYPQFREGAP